MNIDRLCCKRNTKLGSICVDRTSRKSIAITENVDLKCYDNVTRGTPQIIGLKKLIRKIVVFVIIENNYLIDIQSVDAVLRKILLIDQLTLGIKYRNL